MMAFLALTFVQLAHAAFSVDGIGHERLFRLHYRDRVSHLFAIDNTPRNSRSFDIVSAQIALDASCEILLRGRPSIAKAGQGGPPVVLAEVLSAEAKSVLRSLGLEKVLAPDAKISREGAWRLVRKAWIEHREAAAVRYLTGLKDPNEIVLSGATELDEDLHLAAQSLYAPQRSTFTEGDLVQKAMEWLGGVAENADTSPHVFFVDHVFERSVENETPVTLLEPFVPAPSPPDLEAVLKYLGGQLVDHDDETTFMNGLVGEALNQKLAQDYFAMSPERYFTTLGLLSEVGIFEHSYWPGEESLRRHDANVHEHWVDRILHAIADHAAFIVVDAKHVLPTIDDDRRVSLLQLLDERGVTIEAIAPRGFKLQSVK